MANQTSDTWTEDRVAVLTKLYAEGFSASVIGAQMGLSRNAIIGKAHRLQLLPPKERKNVIRKGRELKKHVERRAISKIVTMGGGKRVIKTTEAVEQYHLRCVEIEPRNLTLMDLEPNDCRYPYGDETITFCGHPKMVGKSYCVPHFHLTSESPRAPINRFAGRVAA